MKTISVVFQDRWRLVWSNLASKLVILILAVSALKMEGSTYGQQVLAAVLMAEARGEGEVGMRAVAEVVRRRADDLGTSPLAVLRPGAFTSLNKTSHKALVKKFRNHPLFPTALNIARITYNDPLRLGNRTRGANHFTHKEERPYWSEGHRPVVVIGNHAFYRLPG